MNLDVSNVKKSFGGVKALDKCSLSVEQGKITAIIGPNGSGKTTLFNVISRLLPVDTGKLVFGTEEITLLDDYQVSRLGISRTFQDVRLFENLTIRDHIEIALLNTDESLLKSMFRPQRVVVKRVKEILSLVGLNKPLSTFATDLSYGQRKLLDLAIAIAKPHSLLMLDEPVAGVNPVLRERIKEIIKTLHKRGETILVIEHDMNFVMDLAQHIIVMDAGSVIAQGKPRDIQNNKQVLDAYLGE